MSIVLVILHENNDAIELVINDDKQIQYFTDALSAKLSGRNSLFIQYFDYLTTRFFNNSIIYYMLV